MGCILTVYSQSTYKEYLLPAVMNADHSIVFYKNLFRLSDNVRLDLENRDGAWSVRRSAQFSLTYMEGREDAFERVLHNGDICSLSLGGGEKITLIVNISDRFFQVFDKYSLKDVGKISIGTSQENTIVYDFMHVVSKIHAVISHTDSGYMIEDRSANGLFVNARRVSGSKALEYGDLINVFGLAIVFLGDSIAVDPSPETLRVSVELEPYGEGRIQKPEEPKNETVWLFHRSPRYMPALATDKVKIDAPPEPKEAARQSVFLAVGPSLTMAIPMALGSLMTVWGNSSSSGFVMYAGLITAISSALIGAVWSLVNIRQERKKLREEELKRFEVYGEYLISCSNRVQERYKRNTDIMRQLYIPPDQCCRFDQNSAQLWNRNRSHDDFLQQRAGIGQVPFQVEIEIPEERFSLLNDALASKTKMIRDSFAMLNDVPVCVDFGHKLIGLIGGRDKRGCYPVMHVLAAQLAANNCYTDVKLGFLYGKYDDENKENWSFARWLPHVWAEDKHVRYVADNQNDVSDVFYEIAKVLRMRAEEDEIPLAEKPRYHKPHYVLFIEDVSMLEGELISTFLTDKRDLGVTAVLLAERDDELPNACEFIIENSSRFQGVYKVTDPIENRHAVKFDRIPMAQLEAFARKLSRIQVKETETGGELPSSLTFLDMYGVQRLSELNVEERWRKNRTYDNIRGLLGRKSGGQLCYLDVHEKYHGPHGLIAGTTGSGKSETLQSYMLSLAINYSPDDVGFFVIDYKGGGMANLFSNLPHLIGQISNLSGNQVHRAMVSIKSENMRRQRIFNESGVNNINHYTRLYKNGEAELPVPHMFIIIDEFAELKREEPDFMKELISVAQVGRSLGVHLILATQKPSGTVDDNIWSNSKFRLCLRVQDKQDSKDMLHKPDAAYITQAGRCYLQVGNDELFELFQSGWSGAPYEESGESGQNDIARMLTVTGKAALIGSHTKIKQRDQEQAKWITLLLDTLDKAAGSPDKLLACAEDSIRLGELAERFFENSEILEYPRSDYNIQRIKDLALVYCGAIRLGFSSPAGRVKTVLGLASRSGKKLPERKQVTQLEAVVEYLGRLAQENGYVHNLQLWLPVLPTKLYLRDLQGYRQNAFDGRTWPEPGPVWTLEAYVGLCDDPVNQAQMPLLLDLANNGHHAICGTVVSGKSTFLTTLFYSLASRYSPRSLNLYALDFSGKMLSAFEELAHVGGVLFENDTEKIRKFFTMISGILEERKQLFRGGNYRQYVQAEGNAPSLPAIVIAIDNYAAFRAKTNEIYDDFLLKLSKEGMSCGIFLVITAGGFSSGEIPNRLGENLRTVYCLEMPDRFAYSDALRELHLDVLPEVNVKGRGLAKVGDRFLEFQTALALEAKDDFDRTKKIRNICAELNRHWDGKPARKIPEIPAKAVWQDFAALDEAAAMWREGHRIPVGYDERDASVYGIDLRATYCYIISGKARTGKTNMLRVILSSASHLKDTQLVVVDFQNEFETAAKTAGARRVTTDEELYQYLMELQSTFIDRNRFKKACLESGDLDDEIYDKMQKFDRIMIFIGNMGEFVRHTENPEGEIQPMGAFLSNLFDKGANHNVFWFGCLNQDEHRELLFSGAYSLFIREKAGVHFGGNVEDQTILDFEYIHYSERSKVVKPGIAMLPGGEGTAKVVVPLCRR